MADGEGSGDLLGLSMSSPFHIQFLTMTRSQYGMIKGQQFKNQGSDDAMYTTFEAVPQLKMYQENPLSRS